MVMLAIVLYNALGKEVSLVLVNTAQLIQKR